MNFAPETEYTVPAAEEADPAGRNFREYIRYKMKGVPGRTGRRTVTAAEIADALGMSGKVFREILNGRRGGPDRRDFVLALCAELGLDAEETDEALQLFPGAVRPLSKADPRDRAIIRVLNTDFDCEISCAALDRQLRVQNLPSLKIRYRTQTPDERRNGMERKKINWAAKPEEVRQRYNYYTSLNYDDKTATVLALYTYGGKRIQNFSIKDAYEAFVNGEEYPPPPGPDTNRYNKILSPTAYYFALDDDIYDDLEAAGDPELEATIFYRQGNLRVRSNRTSAAIFI